MNTPFSFRRSTAYHSVVASFVPWIFSQGLGGVSIVSTTPDAMS